MNFKKLMILCTVLLLSGCSASTYTTKKINNIKTTQQPSTFCSHVQVEQIGADALAYYENSAFIGDSRAETIREYDLFNGVDYDVYAAVSLDLNKVFLQRVIALDNGGMGTILDALKQKSFSKIYVSFGLNEIGWYVMDILEEQYVQLVHEIKAIQPTAEIYLMSVYPFAQSVLNQYEYTTIEKLNIVNESIAQVAHDTGTIYFDQSKFLPQGAVYLPEEWTFDGYHLNPQGAQAWKEMMIHEGEGKVYAHEKNPCIR